jgi:hypothetical protein
MQLTITDVTQQRTFSTISAVPGPEQSSAEWITEALYGCGPEQTDYCDLTNFDTADQGEEYAPVPSGKTLLLTGSATMSGVTIGTGSDCLLVEFGCERLVCPRATTERVFRSSGTTRARSLVAGYAGQDGFGSAKMVSPVANGFLKAVGEVSNRLRMAG